MIIETLLLVAATMFIFELLDSSLGQGYGTLGSPVLILFGFDPKIVVPCILISQAIGGFTGAVFHHKYKNADFSSMKSNDAKKVVFVVLCGIIGVVAASVVGIKITKDVMTTYIGIVVTVMGVLILSGKKFHFSWKKLGFVGGLAAVNKGLCYDDKTEILTKTGWKLFKDLTTKDEVAALSKNHVFYWTKPTAIQKNKYVGKMIGLTHKPVNLLVTPNHMLYLKESGKDYELVEASKLNKSGYYILNANWARGRALLRETFIPMEGAVSEQEYDGMVYCCTVPEHVILVRRDGYSTWCGNSGGGYGPVVTGGQVIIGVGGKQSVGITDFAEAPICIAGFIAWVLLAGKFPPLDLMFAMCIGAGLAPPFGAYITKKLDDTKLLLKIMGAVILVLGILCLAKVLNP